jgi:hypothetical protein
MSECPERSRLARKVAEAVGAVYALYDEQNDALGKDMSLSSLLLEARTSQSEAERALRDHICEHRCADLIKATED